MLRTFVESEVDPQALEFNRKELFNVPLFRKLGDLGLLGITVDTEYGGSGMDATAAVIAHGKFIA
jgi:isovaleryl-CoA dehydrogenase